MLGSSKLLLAIAETSTGLDSQTDDKTVGPGSFSPSVKGQGRVLRGGRPIRRIGVRGQGQRGQGRVLRGAWQRC